MRGSLMNAINLFIMSNFKYLKQGTPPVNFATTPAQPKTSSTIFQEQKKRIGSQDLKDSQQRYLTKVYSASHKSLHEPVPLK